MLLTVSSCRERERERERIPERRSGTGVTVPPVRLPKIGGLRWTEEVTPRG